MKHCAVAGLLLALGSSAFAQNEQKIEHPLIKCDEYQSISERMMKHRINGSKEKTMKKVIQGMANENPSFGVYAMIGTTVVEQTFDAKLPKFANVKESDAYIQAFGQSQKDYCTKSLNELMSIE